MVNCLNCGKELKAYPGRKNVNPKRKYCGDNCRSRESSKKQYAFRKEQILRNSNPKLYRELIKKNYLNNKKYWNSRAITYAILKKLKHKNKILIPICKSCGSLKNLEVHHEKYPAKYLEIIDAILNEEIFYLCRDCHKKKTNANKI